MLTYVETGNVDAGIVYSTDALSSSRVRVVAMAPSNSHDPVIYPAAVIKGSKNPAAARVLRFSFQRASGCDLYEIRFQSGWTVTRMSASAFRATEVTP